MPDGIVRIGDRVTFQAFRRTGRRSRRGPLAVVHVPATVGDERVRVAYAVGRRLGGAVARNRLRRQLRAVMRSRHVEGGLPAGSYLVTASPGAEQLSFGELLALVNEALDSLVGAGR